MTLTPEQVAENAKDGTKGPWEIGAYEDLSTFVTDASGNIIAHISTVGLEDTRRIASVPDMEAVITKQAAEIETAKMRERSYKAMLEDQDRKAALRRESLEAQVENLTSRLEAANARVQATEIERLRKALTALVKLNDEDYSPFGGELLQDRVDRAWDNARAALNGGSDQ